MPFLPLLSQFACKLIYIPKSHYQSAQNSVVNWFLNTILKNCGIRQFSHINIFAHCDMNKLFTVLKLDAAKQTKTAKCELHGSIIQAGSTLKQVLTALV